MTHPPPSRPVLLLAELSYRSARLRLDAFAREARALGWPLSLIESGAAERRELPPCAGIFLCNASLSSDARGRLASSAVPVVEASHKQSAPWPQVFVDEEELAGMAVTHFRQLQRRHFSYLGRKGHLGSKERSAAFRRALPPEAETFDALEVEVGSEEMGEVIAGFVKELPRPNCLLCNEDRIANAVLGKSRMLDIDIPEDIAVLSCGDDPLLSSLSVPGLSSIVFPGEEIGRVCARLLDDMIRGRDFPRGVVRIPPEGVHVRASSDAGASEDPVLARAILHIRENMDQPLGVADIARAAGVSRRGLEHRFRNRLGQSVHSFLRDHRISEARKLLRTTRSTVETISELCGYASGATFSRSFKEVTGRSPSDFREQNS